MNPLFQDRREAGRLLAASLTDFAHKENCIILGFDAGSIPVALEVAHALSLPLDRLPSSPESVKRKCVLLVAEGILAPLPFAGAIATLKELGARRVVIAAPIVTRGALTELWPVANDIFFLMSPESIATLPDCYERLPEFPTREADELVRLYRNQQYLEPAIDPRDLVQLRRAQDGANSSAHRGNSRTSNGKAHWIAPRRPDSQ